MHFLTKTITRGALAALLLGAAPGAGTGQEPGGMLFSYAPHPGQKASFDAAYRSHLEWHRENEDSLGWYGWDVIAGRRLGQFVDGTFGISFRALDERVDPAGDAAHASASFERHAEATGRWAVRLRPELGTATPLEDGALEPLAQVVTYAVPVGQREAFEAAARRVRAAAAEARMPPYSVYETVVGGADSEFMLLVWRRGLAGFDARSRDPAAALRDALAGSAGAGIRGHSEVWLLRRDLTRLP